MFRLYFLRGDVPCHISYNKDNPPQLCLMWNVEPKDLDLLHYLPIFFSGFDLKFICEFLEGPKLKSNFRLSEWKFPYNYLVRNGIRDILCSTKVPDQVRIFLNFLMAFPIFFLFFPDFFLEDRLYPAQIDSNYQTSFRYQEPGSDLWNFRDPPTVRHE